MSPARATGAAPGILRDVGLVLHAPAGIAVPIAVWRLAVGDLSGGLAFLATATCGAGLGQLLLRSFRAAEVSTRVHTLAVAALSWAMVGVLGALPLWTIGMLAGTGHGDAVFAHPVNALFEAVSGFTSTGLTLASDPSRLSPAVLLWRSASEWLGGVGILVALLAFLNPAADAEVLVATELSRRSRDSVKDVLRRVGWIYVLYTGLAILSFQVLGMPAWEAMNHGMTAISTGGFTVTSHSMKDYSRTLQVASLIVMIFGATSFYTHAQILQKGELGRLWKDANARLFGILLLVGSILIVAERDEFVMFDTVYQWVTALTTCGLSTLSVSDWRPPALYALVFAMFVGGMSGGTGGGFKTNRVVDLGRGIRIRFRRLWSADDDEEPYRFDDEVLQPVDAHRRVETVAVLGLLWIATLSSGALALRAFLGDGASLVHSLFEAASALGGVGLSAGVTSASLPDGAKLVLIGLMWLGRLEIIPVLVLLVLPFRSPARTDEAIGRETARSEA